MDTLTRLEHATRELNRVQTEHARLIVEARRAGATWDAIGAAANMTRSSVIYHARQLNNGVLPRPREGA